MSFSTWSFKFHNNVIPHSNIRRQRQLFSGLWSGPTPGNFPHRKFMRDKTNRNWKKLFDRFAKLEGKRSRKLITLWWRTHPNEIYWNKPK